MPRRVRIKGVSVPVRRRKLQDCVGQAFKPTPAHPSIRRRIELHTSLRGVKLLSTLIHEMLHQLDHRLSEGTVLRLEESILEMILENPEVFSGLWEE